MFYGWYIVGACCLIMMYSSGANSLGFTAIFDPIVDEFGICQVGIDLPIRKVKANRGGRRLKGLCQLFQTTPASSKPILSGSNKFVSVQ